MFKKTKRNDEKELFNRDLYVFNKRNKLNSKQFFYFTYTFLFQDE